MKSAELRVLSTSGYTDVSITELFHRINRLLPDSQEVLMIPGEMLASKALNIMRQHHYSQLPVAVGTEVLGLFSYRSFSDAVLTICACRESAKIDIGDLTVEECLEKAEFARVTDEFNCWFDTLDKLDAILVGETNRLQGILTPMDVLRYLYRVASPFVLIAEIELSLRALIRHAVNDEKIAECAKTSLSTCYKPERLPKALEEMTFHDYIQIVCDVRHWQLFEPVLKGNRTRTRAKLETINEIRNSVFHLRDITVEDYETLASSRDWMLMRSRAAEARSKGGEL
jgi:predicted transcriptional regulator